jgi:L-lactate utilization protein LutC
LELLEKLGIEVEYPFDQTCCGQPEDYSDWSDAADIDVTIVRSPLAVAETGSVLLTENELRVNTIGFLAHDIVILLDPKDIIRHKA